MRFFKGFGLLVVLSLVACGAGVESPADGGTGGGGGTTGTGGGSGGGAGGGSGGGAGGGGGSSAEQLSVSECQTDMDRFASAQCGDQSYWSAMSSTICPKIPNATTALCAAPLTRAKTCHAQFQTATIACNGFGQADSADPCAVDVLYGVLCVAAMNNNYCASASCTYNQDCPTGYTCNDRTKRCVNTSHNCIGLPCTYNQDCPTGETCNNAIGQCSKQ